MNDLKNFDFIIFGATGFTGKLVVEYALENYSNSEISWAVAGRNTEKLQDLKNGMNLPEEVQIFKVDGDDQDSIDNMINQTKCCLLYTSPSPRDSV